MKLLARNNWRRKRPRGQKAAEPLLVHLVHVREAIGGPLVESSVLDVFADYPGTLLIAAAE